MPFEPLHLAALLLIAPVTEEIVFRLGLHQALLDRLPTVRAYAINIGVACMFGIAHALVRQSWAGLLVALPALLVGLIYERSRQLMPCVLAHAAMNACWVIWSIQSPAQLPVSAEAKASAHTQVSESTSTHGQAT